MSCEELLPTLEKLLAACKTFDLPELHAQLLALPLGYAPLEREMADLVWNASQDFRSHDEEVKEIATSR